ncbi:MAG: Fumarate hydratase class II [Candidatus Peregrinibacteria bacterium GW2011_GWA2_38_36]|nr:MAG: Fumarate hydratase class II [Candidatus Peregrinibacteria bacterium GW2011_GWA2_38_36]
MDKFRIEKDTLGQIQVPEDSYIGSFTARAKQNFQISDLTASKHFIRAIGIVKLISSQSNAKLGLIDAKLAKAIETAAKEFISGKFNEEYTLDVFQAGAGTPFNMNANEIIANRANELLGGKKGEYQFVHPNNHVNMSQSSNDIIPVALCIAILFGAKPMLKSLSECEKALRAKSKQFRNVLKVGRTHLQDAVPITLGQEFGAYADAIKRDIDSLVYSLKSMKYLGIGGTAIGTGINTDPRFKKTFIKLIESYTKIKFKNERNTIESNQNISKFVYFSSVLKTLSYNLLRIANDLKLLNMGPLAGISEISLPEVEPGSSIMPGKINASIVECLQMICLQVIGNDQAVSVASQLGQLELNTTTPLVAFDILWSLLLMQNGLDMFTNSCVKGISANETRCRKNFERSLCTATALNPYLGYQKTAEIVKKALKTGKKIKYIIIDEKILTKKQFDSIMRVQHVTKPYNIKNMLKGLKR